MGQGNGLGFDDIAVDTVDGVVGGVEVPTLSLLDGIPLRYCAFKVDVFKAGAITKRSRVNIGYAIRNSNTGKARAISECHFADTGYTVGNSDAGKARAICKCPQLNTGYTIGDGDTGKVLAI